MRFCDGGFKESYRQTVGLDFFNKKINLPGQVTTTLQIWDIGGQQLGGKMLGNYLYGSHAILLVYDVTSLESFKNISHWLGFVRDTFKDKKEPPLLAVVGNKCDLNHLRAVKAEKHGSFAAEAQALSFFVSAKTGDRVCPHTGSLRTTARFYPHTRRSTQCSPRSRQTSPGCS